MDGWMDGEVSDIKCFLFACLHLFKLLKPEDGAERRDLVKHVLAFPQRYYESVNFSSSLIHRNESFGRPFIGGLWADKREVNDDCVPGRRSRWEQ